VDNAGYLKDIFRQTDLQSKNLSFGLRFCQDGVGMCGSVPGAWGLERPKSEALENNPVYLEDKAEVFTKDGEILFFMYQSGL
jgi:hypothetical protein